MRVTVKFFAALREVVGSRELQLQLDDGSTVASLLERLSREYPRLGALCQAAAPTVNQEYSSLGAELHEGDEVVFIPPVSGGCDDL
ncbi:MAG: MoaD/ThiS family protein [Candidatus Tectomicrobia bacterium]|nr:MoaD/ThiS family protein [Candidatus Tectomicrobia bacterium]